MTQVNTLPFFKQFFENPKEVGSIIPSSKQLVEKMLNGVDFENVQTVVEYGPGTGALTGFVIDHLPASAEYFGVEPNSRFQRVLREKFPQLQIIPDYADRLFDHLDPHYEARVDLVISALPFSLMKWEVSKATLIESMRILRPGGEFRTFVYYHTYYLLLCRRLMNELHQLYQDVEIHQVFRNFPPAKIITCNKT